MQSRGYQLALLTCAMAFGGYVRTVLSPLQEALRIALSLSDNQIAVLQGPAIGLPVALAAIPFGLLIDRYSRTRLLFVLSALSCAGSLLAALATDFTLLLVARSLAGLAGLGIVPIVFSLLADLYEPSLRGRMTTVVSIGQVAGNAIAFALGGTLLARFGAETHVLHSVMLWLVLPLVPIALLMLTLHEPPRTGRAIAHPSILEICKELRRYRNVIVPLTVGILLAETAVGAMLVWSAPMLSRHFDLPSDRVGALMAMAMLVSGILGPFVGGIAADLCQRTGGPQRTLAVLSGLAFSSAPATLFAFMPGVVPATLLLVLALTLALAVAVMGMTLFTIVIPNELRGLCMSALVATNVLFALAVAPVAVSLLSGVLGGPSMIGDALSILCVTVSLLAAATFAGSRRHFREQSALPVDAR